jgi:hypothetical protein
MAPLLYLVGFVTVSTVYARALPPSEQRSFVAWASTNLDHLPSNPVGTLVVSAFIAEGSVIAWLVVGSLALFPLVRRFGNLRAVLLAGGAHVLGSLLSQGLTALRLSIGAVPQSVRGETDVGPSYVIAAALVAVILYGPDRRSRVLAFAGWVVLVPTLFGGLASLEVSGVGHLVSMVTGALIGAVFVAREASRKPRTTGRPVEAATPTVPEQTPAPIPD